MKVKGPDLTALMTSFRVGIISSSRISGGKPRSSTAASVSAAGSEEEEESDEELKVMKS